MTTKPILLPYLNDEDFWHQKTGRKQTRHHIVPSSRCDKWSDNKTIKLYENLHNAFHRVFWNAIFQEQLEQLLKINWPVLSDKYKKDIQEILEMDDKYVYRNGIRIKR